MLTRCSPLLVALLTPLTLACTDIDRAINQDPSPGACDLERRLGEPPRAIKQVKLQGVFNASGMVLDRHAEQRVVTGSDWVMGNPLPGLLEGTVPPSLVVSAAASGKMIEGRSAAKTVFELEGLSWKGSEIAALYQEGGKAFIQVGSTRTDLDTDAAGAATGKHSLRLFEGLAHNSGHWVVLMTISRQAAGGDPHPHQMEMYLASFKDGSGALAGVKGPVQTSNGEIIRELGGDLLRLPSGKFLIPGFNSRGLKVVSPDGTVLKQVDLDTRRVEGIAFDKKRCDLLLVRECAGPGDLCNEPPTLGTPLWIMSY